MKKLYEDRLEIINCDLKTAAIKRDWKTYGNLKDEKKEILLKIDELKNRYSFKTRYKAHRKVLI